MGPAFVVQALVIYSSLSFANREEARAWIRRLVEGPTSYLECNESIPPTYAIIEVGSRSF